MKGTIRRRASGAWAWQFTATDANGDRRHYSKGGFRTRKAAQAALTDALAKFGKGERPTLARTMPTLTDWVEQEWLPATSGHLKPATVASYEWLWCTYIRPRLGHLKVGDITPGTLTRTYTGLRAAGGRNGRALSEATVHRSSIVVSSALAYAVDRHIIPVNPTQQIPRRDRLKSTGRDKPEIQTWTRMEAQQFLSETAQDRLSIAWRLLLGTGARRGEIAALRWQDVDLDAGAITIRRNRVSIAYKVTEGTPKSDRGRRVTIDPGLVSALRSHKRLQREAQLRAGTAWTGGTRAQHVLTDELGQPFHPEHLTKTFRTAARRAGVAVIRLHDLRHTHATLLLADGVPAKVVSERLGHGSIAITLDLYSHVTAELEHHAAARIAQILGGD